MGTEHYLQDFEKLEKNLPGHSLSWLREARRQSIANFSRLGFPTVRDEEWRFTPLGKIPEIPFALSSNLKPPLHYKEENGLTSSDLKGFALEKTACQIVFVNGRWSPSLSKIHETDSLEVGSLRDLLKREPGALEGALASHADPGRNSFAALNTSFFEDGAFVRIPRGSHLPHPIHLIFYSSSNGKTTVSYPRVLILAGEESKAVCVESYFGSGTYLTSAVTEIVMGENASLEHIRLQRESHEAFHVSTLQVHQGGNSRFVSHNISFGGLLARNDLNIFLEAQGAECELLGLYRVFGRQHVDNHTAIDHLKGRTHSRELYKGVLDGKSRAVFNGKIIVRPDAQKTDAMQTNKNLLLSEGSRVNTKPELQIFANDVKCRHGATIGQISPEQLFYLRSRGIEKEEARSLLIHGFISEMIERLPIRIWKEMLPLLPLREKRSSFEVMRG